MPKVMKLKTRRDAAIFIAAVAAFCLTAVTISAYLTMPPDVFDQTFRHRNILTVVLSASVAAMFSRMALAQQRLHERLAEARAREAEREARARITLQQAKDEAEAACRAKDRFLAKMSHELRTPMNGVLGVAALLAASPMDPEMREKLRLLQASGEDMMALVNDLLETSMADYGAARITRRPTNVAMMLRDLVLSLEPIAARAKTRLRLNVDPQLDADWSLDDRRIRQVVSNFATNAIKYASEDDIAIRARYTEAGDLRIEVADRGPGVPPALRDRIFERFIQIEDGREQSVDGVGLGLSICREIAAAMGGATGVEPATPRGSIFWFQSPIDAAEARLPDESADEALVA